MEYKQVVVEVPEDRVAEFHAFFARFLAGPGRRRRGRHGMAHHGHSCQRRGHTTESDAETQEPTGEQPTEV